MGRGCLAGPVFAGCVILDQLQLEQLPLSHRELIRDSKTLSARQRADILPVIQQIARSWAIGIAGVEEIEKLGIVKAVFLAMCRALCLISTCDVLLVDGKFAIPGLKIKQQAIVGGDKSCYSIAAASIVAKTARDHYMAEQSRLYPLYHFEKHVGYGTRLHLDKIAEFGICPLHRRNFKPCSLHVVSNFS